MNKPLPAQYGSFMSELLKNDFKIRKPEHMS